MEVLCNEQSRWMRGETKRSIYGQEGLFTEKLYTETEKTSAQILASINEYMFLTFFGQMAECKDIVNEKETVENYMDNFLDHVNPILPEAFDAMTREEQNAKIDESKKIFFDELVSLKLQENYWVMGIASSTTALYLRKEFENDPDVRVLVNPLGKYIWNCMEGRGDEVEEPIGRYHTVLTLQTKTKGESVSTTSGIATFPSTVVIDHVLAMLKGRPRVARLKDDLFKNWCIIHIDTTTPCVDLSPRVLSALVRYGGDIYSDLDGRSMGHCSYSAKRAEELLRK